MIYLINLVADESINLNIIAGMIMKKEGDRLALADIRNRIDVDTCPHLQNFAEGKKETSNKQTQDKRPSSRTARKKTTRPADRQDRQQPETRKYQLHNAARELGDGSLESFECLLAQGTDVEEKDQD